MDAFDLVVIGGGSGGLTSTVIAARLGARVLLVDRQSLGGDCLHYGCVPSKALIASANMAHRMRRAADWGIEPVEVKVDFDKVMARIRTIQDEIGAGESPEALTQEGAEVAMGGARFLDPHTLQIGADRKVRAERIIIATGSRAVPPEIPGLKGAGFLDHVGVFSMKTLPARLAVIGGGPIGCELGQALSRLGSEVTIVQRGDRVLAKEEPEVSALLQSSLQAEGIEVLTRAQIQSVDRTPEGKRLTIEREGQTQTLLCDEILVAVGRRPNLESLSLDAAEVEHNEKGVIVNELLQTSQSHIYAVGDVNGGPQFTHWAEHEARIATRNALFKGNQKRAMERLPRVTFTDPEVASLGLTLADAKGQKVHTHQIPMHKVDRAVCEGESSGFLMAVVDAKDRVLGVHAVGAHAGELLAEWTLAMEHDISLEKVGSAIHAYPTFTRANRRLADERFLDHGISGWLTKFFANFTPREPKAD